MPTNKATTPTCAANSQNSTLPLNASKVARAIKTGKIIRSRKLSTMSLREFQSRRLRRFPGNLDGLEHGCGDGRQRVKRVHVALDELADIRCLEAELARLRFLGLVVMNLGVEVFLAEEPLTHTLDIPIRVRQGFAARETELSFQFPYAVLEGLPKHGHLSQNALGHCRLLKFQNEILIKR